MVASFATYQPGWYESAIATLGLNFTINYIGRNFEAELLRTVSAKYAPAAAAVMWLRPLCLSAGPNRLVPPMSVST